jgi:hypothetical protein
LDDNRDNPRSTSQDGNLTREVGVPIDGSALALRAVAGDADSIAVGQFHPAETRTERSGRVSSNDGDNPEPPRPLPPAV